MSMALLSGALLLPTTTPFTSPHKSHLSFFKKPPALPPSEDLLPMGHGSCAPPLLWREELQKKAEAAPVFRDPRWIGGTWDLKQFVVEGKSDWNTLIDAEVRRRKWLEDNPEASSNDEPVVFDTSIIPWWAWIKRFHLPEAERLNGRAAMVGFFMAYVVDSLTGVGLVDQMDNFFCKILLLIAVGGVFLIRKTEDLDTLKKLLEESIFYDKQWQASWKDDTNSVGTGIKE